MNIVFWNTHRNTFINKYLLKLIEEKNIDIVLLSEYVDKPENLINDLYINGLRYKMGEGISCKKINVIFKNNIKIFLNDDNANYISLKTERNNLKFQLFALHFPSKLRTGERERNIIAQEMKNDIKKHKNAVILGDFNSNPFEESIVALSGFNALPTKEKKKRTVQGKTEKILYNPMWRFLGEFEDMPGTYFYDNSSDINYYWNLFDQILITQDFIEYFESEKLEIIKKISDINLVKNKKIDNKISDHLPIFLSLKEED
jgi:hypothetical protein